MAVEDHLVVNPGQLHPVDPTPPSSVARCRDTKPACHYVERGAGAASAPRRPTGTNPITTNAGASLPLHQPQAAELHRCNQHDANQPRNNQENLRTNRLTTFLLRWLTGAQVRVPPQARRGPGVETALPAAPFALSCGLRLPADAAAVIYCAVH